MQQYKDYNEDQWIKTIFLLSDMQGWFLETEKILFYQLPIGYKKKLFRHDYYMSCRAMAHILERHYYKISRHSNCSKFTIPLMDIVSCIMKAAQQPTRPIPNSVYLQRTITEPEDIGLDKYGHPVHTITVITEM